MRFFILFTFVVSSFISKADQWDDLSYEEAENVIEYLRYNPYIFEYCDCCVDEEDDIFNIDLVLVSNVQIVACEWKPEKYSVTYDFEVLAMIQYDDDGRIKKVEIPYESAESTHTIYMNYTWGLNSESKLAQPLFDIITYDNYGNDHLPCKKAFPFPTPGELEEVGKFKAYKQWYKNYVQ